MKNDCSICNAIESVLGMADEPLEKMAKGEALPVSEINNFLAELKDSRVKFQELSPEIRKICCSIIEILTLMYNYSNMSNDEEKKQLNSLISSLTDILLDNLQVQVDS
jgi:hypothetical protein